MLRRHQQVPEPREDPRRVEALRRLDDLAGAGDLDVAAYVRARAALTSGLPADVEFWLDRLGSTSRSPDPAPPDASPPDASPPETVSAPPPRGAPPRAQPGAAPVAAPVAAPDAAPVTAPVAAPVTAPVTAAEAGPFAPASGAVNLGPGRATANLPPVPIYPSRPRWWRRLG